MGQQRQERGEMMQEYFPHLALLLHLTTLAIVTTNVIHNQYLERLNKAHSYKNRLNEAKLEPEVNGKPL